MATWTNNRWPSILKEHEQIEFPREKKILTQRTSNYKEKETNKHIVNKCDSIRKTKP